MTWRAILEQHLPTVARRAGRDTIRALVDRLAEVAESEHTHRAPPEVTLARLLPRLTAELHRAEDTSAELRESLAIARSQGNERAALVEVLTRLGEPGLEQDLVALDRYLDTEAIEDRLLLGLHHLRQQWEYLATVLVALAGSLTDSATLSCRDAAATVLAQARRPWTQRVAACHLLGVTARRRLPGTPSARQTLLNLAQDMDEDPWVQSASLERWLDLQEDPADAERVLRQVLLSHDRPGTPIRKEHAFVRARACRMAGEHGFWDLVREVVGRQDPSEHVACSAVRVLSASRRPDDIQALATFIADGRRRDIVRATAVVATLPRPDRTEPSHWHHLVTAALGCDAPWVVGVVLRALLDRLPLLGGVALDAEHPWRHDLERWSGYSDPDLAEAAAMLRLALDVQGDPRLEPALAELRKWVGKAREGAQHTVRDSALARLTSDEILDVMAVAATDFDLSAQPLGEVPGKPPRRGYRLFKGEQPSFQPWRLMYEVRRPRPDKRQAHSFVTDRVPPAALLAPSNRLAEVTPTAVPGQRLATPTRLSWNADLPLPSFLIAAARHGSLRVRTPSVSYRIQRQSAVAGVAAQRRYNRLANLRARMLGSGAEGRSKYDAAVAEAGFRIDRAAAFLPLLHLDDLAGHLVALDSNTVPQLTALTGGLLAWWIGRGIVRRRVEAGWREGIPLVVGGWGSRGKSGTERLKAAVFHGTGYSVLSKTTGCEAMVVASIPGREPTEIFLYRPYDKATIFEQRNAMRYAWAMAPQVFLWECMALNPYYVEILQQDWVRDDYTTITNTYPDHEDIQGPAGRDVADVISRFIPFRGHVLTSEQHMVPVLAQQADRRGSKFTAIRPEDFDLLPPDLLARFPYQEHPRNIALVVRLAETLGIERDVALRAMADHVVPDLGVLKEYGPANYQGRVSSYICGNSANERAGFLSNWDRTSFGDIADDAGLGQFHVVLVNNRADRLARQEVFAQIAALDANADALAVIGTNVEPFGLAWKAALQSNLRDRMRDFAKEGRQPLVEAMARRIRRFPLPLAEARSIALRAGAAVEPIETAARKAYSETPGPVVQRRFEDLAGKAQTIDEAAAQWIRETAWLHRLSTTDTWDPNQAIATLIEVLESRLILLRNPALTGDQVIHPLILCAPPGARVRILGSANIKGTGLDVVYRWIYVHKVKGYVDALSSSDPAAARDGLRALANHPNYGVADARVAVAGLRRALHDGPLHDLGLADEALSLADRLESVVQQKEADLAVSADLSRFDKLKAWTRNAVDFYDSVKRRREADALYTDLAARRIGQDRAAEVARALVYRGKV